MGETTTIVPNVDTSHANDNPEYEAEMIAKAEAGTGVEPEAKLYAGKYKSEEALQKGVLELIKHQNGGDLEAFYTDLMKNTAGKAEDTDSESTDNSGKPEESTEEDDTDQSDSTETDEKGGEESPDEDKAEGIDFSQYANEYDTTGELSAESKQALVDSGIPEQMVDDYISGMDALRQVNQQLAYSIVGGEDNYMDMINYASNNLPKDEQIAFNEALTDKSKSSEAIQGLWNKYTEANPQFVEAASAQSSTGVQGFKSEAEFKSAMKDPRYGKDRAYTEEVENKLAVSKLI